MAPHRAILLPAAVAVFFSAACAGPRQPAGEAQPYTILCDGSSEEVKSLSDSVGEIFELYAALFEVDPQKLPPLALEVKTLAAASVAEFPAFFRAEPRGIRFQWPPDRGLLLHEIAHHFTLGRIDKPLPVCLNEGLATYLGWSALGEEGLVLGEIAVEHSRTAARAAAAGAFVPLREFLAMPPERFYDRTLRRLHYGQAWAFVYFLFRTRMPDSLAFAGKVDRLADLTPDAAAAMEPAFVDFWRTFSASDLLVAQLDVRSVVRCQSAAFRLGLLQDSSAAGALLRVAADPLRPVPLREVALSAAAMVLLGPDGRRVKAPFQSTLRRLADDRSEAMRKLARELDAAIDGGHAAAIQSRFGALGCDSPFYPAGSFQVSYE